MAISLALVPEFAWGSENTGAQDRPSSDSKSFEREIVVSGERVHGMAASDIPPLSEIGEREIGVYAAGTISELLAALAPRTRGAGFGPIILVNGERIANLAQIGNLPPEALLRIEILPEEAGLVYGLGADRRVVNLILRENFRAITVEGEAQRATDGGLGSFGGDFDIARIAGQGRWNVHARYSRNDALFEADRNVAGGQGIVRTLLPSNEKTSLSGSWSGKMLENVAFDLGVTLDFTRSEARIGPSPDTSESGGRDYLARRRTGHSTGLSASADGAIGEWSWFASATYDHTVDRTRTERLAMGPGILRDRARNRTTVLLGTALFNGPIAELPAGTMRASVELEGGRQILRSRSSLGLATEAINLARSRVEGSVTISVPLAGGDVMPSIGRLAVEFEGSAETLSGQPTIDEYGAGLRWSPIPQVRLAAFWSLKEEAPELILVGGPLIVTPNEQLFDFVRGETVTAERLDGGNPSLRPESSKSMRLSLSIQPETLSNLHFTASYVRRRVDGPVLPLPAVTPELAIALPQRFVRDASGLLVRFDARPINFESSARDRVNWTLTWSKHLAAPRREIGDLRAEIENELGAGPKTGTLLLSLDHRILLRDRLTPFANGPGIDFLTGAAGGVARHAIELDARILSSGLGANFDLSWSSGYRATGSFGEFKYPDLAQLDLKLFANLGEVSGKWNRIHWSRGARIVLEIDNVFNTRRRVVDRTGAIPRALQPAYLDPLGRTVKLSLRKLF